MAPRATGVTDASAVDAHAHRMRLYTPLHPARSVDGQARVPCPTPCDTPAIGPDRTNTQIEYSDTHFRNDRRRSGSVSVTVWLLRIICTYIPQANATLAVVRHHPHQQRERHKHDAHNQYSTAVLRGPGARGPPIHTRMPATSARNMSRDLVDSAHPPRAATDAATHAQA